MNQNQNEYYENNPHQKEIKNLEEKKRNIIKSFNRYFFFSFYLYFK
jgi:hypothetical protein